MRDAIRAGVILIERGTPMPNSWPPQGGPGLDGWIPVGKPDRPGLEARIREAGWTFFYLAGEIRATVFGFNEQETLHKAVKRLTTNLKARELNCLEITRVSTSSFLGVPYVTVAGHARHIQEGMAIRRRRSAVTEAPLSAEEAVAAWEDEGGASRHTSGRQAA